MKALLRLATLLGVATFLARLYARRLRPRVLDWGATPEESARTLPGDEILDDIAVQTTRAITIDAPPEDVWPWLVQMGPRPRAGVYTYDWIERLLGIDIENSDRILPEFQHLEVGEFLGLDKSGSNGLAVRRVEGNRALVLQWVPATATWAFVLERSGDERTRLLSRNRIPGSGLGFRLGMAFMEPGSLVMERKMLEGIKERVERHARAGVAPV